MYRRLLRRAAWAPAACGLAVLFSRGAWADEPLAINAPAFAIPVQVAADDADVAEVRLYVSNDLGRTWQIHDRARPPLEEYEFKAPGDGEYWFCVRTADATGRESPDGPTEAELKVVVDTQPPQVELAAERNASGDVVVNWRVAESNVVESAPLLQYRVGAETTWHDFEPLRSKRNGGGTDAAGSVEFRPADGSGVVFVRASTADLAGNKSNKEIAVAGGLALPNDSAPLVAQATTQTANALADADKPVPMAHRDSSSPMMVNSSSFELDYDVDRVPLASIEKVELWGTRDEGRTWLLLGTDEDRRSPCTVNVEREGKYGFAIVVTAAGGVTGRRPQNGEAPEIRVGVDLTPPQVRLTTAEPGPDGEPNVLKINWTAGDEHLGPRSVSLAYSSSTQGPWLPLALGVPNDGSRLCKFDAQAPESVYLRIEVRDDAGNLGAFSTTAPVPIEKRQVNLRHLGTDANARAPSTPKWFHVLR